jgi:hypothetical protein
MAQFCTANHLRKRANHEQRLGVELNDRIYSHLRNSLRHLSITMALTIMTTQTFKTHQSLLWAPVVRRAARGQIQNVPALYHQGTQAYLQTDQQHLKLEDFSVVR